MAASFQNSYDASVGKAGLFDADSSASSHSSSVIDVSAASVFDYPQEYRHVCRHHDYGGDCRDRGCHRSSKRTQRPIWPGVLLLFLGISLTLVGTCAPGVTKIVAAKWLSTAIGIAMCCTGIILLLYDCLAAHTSHSSVQQRRRKRISPPNARPQNDSNNHAIAHYEDRCDCNPDVAADQQPLRRRQNGTCRSLSFVQSSSTNGQTTNGSITATADDANKNSSDGSRTRNWRPVGSKVRSHSR